MDLKFISKKIEPLSVEENEKIGEVISEYNKFRVPMRACAYSGIN